MNKLYLTQYSQLPTGKITVTDKSGHVKYHIYGEVGKVNARLYILDQSGNELASILQTATGFFPRFILTTPDHQKIGSIGFSFQFHEVIFISDLNWLINSFSLSSQYQVRHFHHLLMSASPDQHLTQVLSIYTNENEAYLVLIAAFLNRLHLYFNRNQNKWLNLSLRQTAQVAQYQKRV